MNILAIGAHPDDIEMQCAGTLALYAQQGHKVFMAVATNGNVGAVGFCWGGGMVNQLAASAPDNLGAAVAYYGRQPAAEQSPNLRQRHERDRLRDDQHANPPSASGHNGRRFELQ